MGYETLKRLIDVLVSSVGLILLLPLFAIVALLIRLDSKGPILLRQERVGKNNKRFKLYKFRTMISGAEALSPRYRREDLSTVTFQRKDDSWITRVGKFLRRGFDELPGLVNVLKGDMSLVGPRPELPEIVDLYDEREKERLKVKPGITGLAIINGRGNLTIRETIEWDLKYVKCRSMFQDMKILVQTLWVVLITGKGAR
jgi:lipopolysaccharide/colanic/teichoic acid biosynthesis glycosyltransferase